MHPERSAAQLAASERAAALVRELFEEYARMVLVVCQALLRDRQEAEDAAQQTFLGAHQALLGGTEPRDPAAWLATIARNECRSRRRQRATRPTAVAMHDVDAHDVNGDPVDYVYVRALLRELPPRQRAVIALHCFYGLTYEEVAAELEVTNRAVDGLLTRARDRLRRRLRSTYRSGGLLVPEAVRDRLTQLLPGFDHGPTAAAAAGGAGAAVSAPLAAKLAAATAGVAVLGQAGADVRVIAEHRPDAAARAAPRAEVVVSPTRVPARIARPLTSPGQTAERVAGRRLPNTPVTERRGRRERHGEEPRDVRDSTDNSGPGSSGSGSESVRSTEPVEAERDGSGSSSGRSGSGRSSSGSSGSGSGRSGSSGSSPEELRSASSGPGPSTETEQEPDDSSGSGSGRSGGGGEEEEPDD